MSDHHLSIYERRLLEVFHQQGKSARWIAKELGRHHATIRRELNRNAKQEAYDSKKSEKAYLERRKASIPKGKWTPQQAAIMEEKLQATWSPEQITGRLLKGVLTTLRQKGKRKKPVENRGKFAVGKTFAHRPKEVESRDIFGHWELDTIVSGRGKSKGCVATFIERKTRLYTAIRMPNRTAQALETAFHTVATLSPASVFKTVTTDRGKEFACYSRLEAAHGMEIFFADPYPSWQRDANENAKGLLREFSPTLLKSVTNHSSLRYISFIRDQENV